MLYDLVVELPQHNPPMRGWGVAWSCNVYLAQSRPWLQSLAPKPEKKKKSSPSLCQWLSGVKAPETQGSCLAAWPFFPGLGPSVQGKPLLRSHPTILVPVGSVPSSLQADATGWVGDAFGDGSASCCVLWSAAFQGGLVPHDPNMLGSCQCSHCLCLLQVAIKDKQEGIE